jgi:hypothetical protein
VTAAILPACAMMACSFESSKLMNRAKQFGWVHLRPELAVRPGIAATGVFENEGAIDLLV